VLDHTWLVLTSDHGEIFERGLRQHGTPTLYQPEIRVPLLIFEPGRREGGEIHSATSAVDLLPTLAHVTGHIAPNWTEGKILPPFTAGADQEDRSVYSLMAVHNNPLHPIHEATTMIIRGQYKLQNYSGYKQYDRRETQKLFDIVADPEEMNDLSGLKHETTAELLAEVNTRIAEADQPYL
jgi:choline-sulfatase